MCKLLEIQFQLTYGPTLEPSLLPSTVVHVLLIERNRRLSFASDRNDRPSRMNRNSALLVSLFLFVALSMVYAELVPWRQCPYPDREYGTFDSTDRHSNRVSYEIAKFSKFQFIRFEKLQAFKTRNGVASLTSEF